MSLLAAHNLTKSYSGVTVLSDVSFELRAGEVHALVGENGAGKSTLCRILCGVVPPTAGSMSLRGAPYAPASRKQAEAGGVRMVLQELNLLPTLTVAENIYIDSMPRRLGVIGYRRLNENAAGALATLGLRDVAPERLVGSLGVGQAQLVEIAAALAHRCEVLVLDEPTAALTTPEIELLFGQIARLKSQGVGIIYVSHRMEEIRRICDRITVLRDGRFIATRPVAEVSPEDVVRLMVGRDLPRAEVRPPTGDGAVALRVDNVRGVSFEVREGEILGFAGLMGSGRTELMRAIFGADPDPTRGTVSLRGRPVRITSPRHAVRRGIALLTEDRKGQGLLLPTSIRRNTTLPRLASVSLARTLVSGRRERAVADKYASALSLRCHSVDQPVGQLSGGNQQKVVIAKWLFRDCDVLIFDEPTRGIDVGAKFEIYRLLRELASQGKAVIVVSSDLPELLALADRIAVMSAGRLARVFGRGEWSQESIMEAALSGYRTDSAK